MTAATNFVQTEVPAPAYKVIADQIVALATVLKADGADQETIRAAIHVFGSAAGGTPSGVSVCNPRPY
jgi:hypothetical protein